MTHRLTRFGLLLALLTYAAHANAQARLRNNSPSSKPQVGAGAGAGPGIVADPGFEAGTPNPSWTEFSLNFGTPLCTVSGCSTGGGTGPHSGTWWSWFGGTSAAEFAFVEQSVTIPAGTADLTFWLEIPVAELPGELRVKLGSTTIATFNQADTTAYSTYQLVTLDIDAFAGATHVLRFEADNVEGDKEVINFFIDDVQITAVPSGPSLQVAPTSINFGGVQTGTTSAPQVVTLTNNGTADVTISSITPSGAGYAVNTTGTDLTLDPAQSTTFTVTFGPPATGVHPGSIIIASNAPGTPTVTLVGTGTNYVTYPSTGGPVAIPDGVPTGISSTIVVPAGAPTVGDLDVDVNITHTWVGDLTLNLTKEATSSLIFDRPGVPETTFGCEGNNLDIVLDDQGADGSVNGSCTTGTPAYPVPDGHYTPDNPLTAFNGASATGTWTLVVADHFPEDSGTLESWALLVTPAVAGEDGPGAGVSALAIAPNPISTAGQVQLSVATTQDVRVALFDALGREVAVLYEGTVTATQVAYIALQTEGLAPGAYVVRATGQDFAASQRLTVTR